MRNREMKKHKQLTMNEKVNPNNNKPGRVNYELSTNLPLSFSSSYKC
jgi:hypothetical protein